MDTRRSLRTIALACGLTVALMGAAALAERVRDIPGWLLMGDPAAVTDRPFYLGAVTLSRTGLLAAAAGASLVAAWALRGRARADAEFLAAIGAFQAALVLDDKFQVHEVVLGDILEVPQLVTFGAIGLVALAGVVRYRDTVRRHPEGWVLLAALVLFAMAAVADQIGGVFDAYVETSIELAGITCLSLFGIRSSALALMAALAPAGASTNGTVPSNAQAWRPTVAAPGPHTLNVPMKPTVRPPARPWPAAPSDHLDAS